MREIDTDGDATFLRGLRDGWNVEQLAGEKIHAGNQHDRELIGVLLNKIDNVFGSHGEFAFARTGENERVLGTKSVMRDLGFDRVGVGRKRRIFHQDFEPRFCRPIKRRHHHVQVDREAVHADHFNRLRTGEPCHRFAQSFMIRVPRGSGRVMRFNAELGPVIQLFFDKRARRFRHQA